MDGGKAKGAPDLGEALDTVITAGADASESSRLFIDRLDAPDRQALISKACREWHSAGSVICHEGDPGDALYIIERGSLAVLKELGDGRSSLLGYRGPGEIVGEMSLLGHHPRSASLIAAEDVELLRVGAADFPNLMDKHPSFGWAILNVLSERLQAADIARTTVIREEQHLTRRLERLTGEATRLAELARARQETIELIVHDLRTPLAVMYGCLEIVQASLPAETLEPASDALRLAERNARRLMALLEQLLNAARQDVSDARLAFQPVDVVALLHRVVESARVSANKYSISLALHVSPDLPQPLGDAAQVERVVTNLLDNAISYTPARGKVEVMAQKRQENVQVSITDTGPGVPAEHRKLIFERFTRVPGVKGRKKGFGLGLYFCRQVVKAHGGRIWVEPGPGEKGSRFIFTLPMEQDRSHD